jgi:outer membrane protein TolC
MQLEAARQSETQARARYDAGLADIVAAAEAQNLLAQAESQDRLARIDVWRALLGEAAARGDLDGFVALVRRAGAR